MEQTLEIDAETMAKAEGMVATMLESVAMTLRLTDIAKFEFSSGGYEFSVRRSA